MVDAFAKPGIARLADLRNLGIKRRKPGMIATQKFINHVAMPEQKIKLAITDILHTLTISGVVKIGRDFNR